MKGLISFFKKRRGQVWVETVIYTLISLAIIGIVLGIAKPQIDKQKSKIVIEQSIESMGLIDLKIGEALPASGNQRTIDLKIGEGSLFFNLDNESIYWIIDSKFEYSEEGVPIPIGLFSVTTTKENGNWKVKIERKYNLDLSFNTESNGIKELASASVPYHLVLENNGKNSEGETIIDFRAG